jgi:transposase
MSTAATISRKSRDGKYMNHAQRRLRRIQIAQDIHDNRLTIDQAAKKYGVSVDLVRRAMRESELFDRHSHLNSRLIREQVAYRAQEGESIDLIARETGLAETSVTKIAREFGLSFPKGSTKDRTLAIVAALFDRDKSVLAIAHEFRVSTQYVYQVLQRATAAGIPVPPRGRRRPDGNPFASVSMSTVDL